MVLNCAKIQSHHFSVQDAFRVRIESILATTRTLLGYKKAVNMCLGLGTIQKDRECALERMVRFQHIAATQVDLG